MSHYLTSRVQIRSRAALVAALEEMGYRPVVSDVPIQLLGYRGDVRPETATVVVPRRQLRPGANDLGFVELEDGTWEVVASVFDRGAGTGGAEWAARLTQLAGVHASLNEAARLGLVAERVDGADGAVDVYVYAQEG